MNDIERLTQENAELKEAVRLLLKRGRWKRESTTGDESFCVFCDRIVWNVFDGELPNPHAPDCPLERARRLVGE